MPSARASPPAFSLSTIGDYTLLDARFGCITAPRRACLRPKQYSPAPPAGSRGGGCRRLPALRALACRLACEPSRIGPCGDPARVAADRHICAAPDRPDLGDCEPGPVLDDTDHHSA